MNDLTYFPMAFACGVIGFFSPCLLPVVAPFLTCMAGIGLNSLRSGEPHAHAKIFRITCCYVAGFSTVFLLIGVKLSFIRLYLLQYADIFIAVSGIILFAVGVHCLGLRIPWIYKARINVSFARSGGLVAYFMGLAFSLSWMPCIGPVLGIVLTMAMNLESTYEIALLMLCYSLGLGVPFVLASISINTFMQIAGNAGRYSFLVEKGTGILLVGAGTFLIAKAIWHLV